MAAPLFPPSLVTWLNEKGYTQKLDAYGNLWLHNRVVGSTCSVDGRGGLRTHIYESFFR
jgi:hypothetical protein